MALEELLNESLGGKILSLGSEDYQTSNSSYFTVFESNVKPAFIAQPISTQDVSKLIKVLGLATKEHGVLFAIRGTGHTPFAGSANIEGGVTIDLRGLKGISLNKDEGFVKISVGETWGSVYDELEKHGLTTAGGRVGRVGVAGLVLGGGLSFYSTRRGFACDSVIDFEVVLASGEIVHANSKENVNLWTSLRGGLNNFGVVTSIKMNIFESGPIWGGVAFFAPSTFDKLIQTTVDFVKNETDEDTHIMSSAGYAFGNYVVTCCMYQTKGVENPPSLQPFSSLPHKIEGYGSLRTSTHIGFCNELSSFTSDGVRSFYATLTMRPDVALMSELHQAWIQTLEPLKDVDGFIFSLGFFPLTRALLRNSEAAGGNGMDIKPEDGPLLIVLINPTWNSADDDDRVYQGVEQFLAESKRLASAKNLLHNYLFTNYAYCKEHVFAGYSTESLEILKEVSKKYDPEGVFQKAVPGGFKLPL